VASGSIFARAGSNGAGAVLSISSFSVNFFTFTATSTASSLLFDGNTTQENYTFDLSVKEMPASTFLRENEEPDGSDIVDITRKPDNSGWTGDGLDYDYAEGALPERTYSDEYSDEYS
jgi:hypothetical protein